MKKKMLKIKAALREDISISAQSAPNWSDGKWEVCLKTENNEYPHWLKWTGDDLDRLLNRVIRYLSGKAKQPHGRTQVPCSAWTKEAL